MPGAARPARSTRRRRVPAPRAGRPSAQHGSYAAMAVVVPGPSAGGRVRLGGVVRRPGRGRGEPLLVRRGLVAVGADLVVMAVDARLVDGLAAAGPARG